MARHKLSDRVVRHAADGWHGDGDGLWLRVQGAAASWVFVWVRQGKRNELGLGSARGGTAPVGLALARRKADQVRAILAEGGDPRETMSTRATRASGRTFGEIAEEVIRQKEATLRNAVSAAQWRTTLEGYCAAFWSKPVDRITLADVARCLEPTWLTTHATASRTRGRIEAVFDRAKALGLRDGENPARWRGGLDHVLGEVRKTEKKHHAAMPWREVPDFVSRLRQVDTTAARAMEFVILTAVRSSEAREATFDEFDLEAAVWTIPASRMKAGREHIVPLSPRALAIVRQMREAATSPYVFPGRPATKPLTGGALDDLRERMGLRETLHGFRSSLRDWAGDVTSFEREVAEQVLAHRVGNATETAYRRGTALAKRRDLMTAWAGFVAGEAAEVVALKAVQS